MSDHLRSLVQDHPFQLSEPSGICCNTPSHRISAPFRDKCGQETTAERPPVRLQLKLLVEVQNPAIEVPVSLSKWRAPHALTTLAHVARSIPG